ncbi:DUF3135 domain-containing protein [Dechloromonas agitata]|uniref:DUF3135 domain-containing protein n=1 Tax=Dechloromonas agitata TaxID=73030 RepID=UPI00237E7948|nr:DUF3135 domain-containing protein [Dechloromonas agitata]MDE1543996.1 DUF3135 domain-containing protein [Dechloromonas agitata]
MNQFNFDELSNLARLDPQSFFDLRSKTIRSAILTIGEVSPKLGALQDQIDEIRARTVTPQASLAAITALLEQRMVELKEAIASARAVLNPDIKTQSPGFKCID